ncbi:formate dehydrogenase subunit gamma [Thalassotalea fonticola]|uniref:NADH-quinone oxidoreductase subunit E n=1 Tax=Thalassotalea fonticola TaxID=3065649 RepID=A0ABZ0GM24_9GAMM|nr:formate dehydrogenase subunit gamma [Colwelliaceae bacterium S1-1]
MNTNAKAQSPEQTIKNLVDNKKDLPGALLPILHDIQHQFGFIPKSALAIIAQGLQQTEAEIYGVITFYAHFHLEQPGRHTIEICRGEACQAMGSKALEQAVKNQLGIDYGQTSANKNFTLEPVYCLGNCACSPSIKVGVKTYGRMTSSKFSELTETLSLYQLNLGEEL